MHAREPYDPHGDARRDLPIARPGEWSPMRATPQGDQPPALGASYTSAATGDGPVPARDDLDETPPHDLQLLTWQLAARLTSGMLANPSRGTASVKDAMGLFDQFLHEMHAYMRISSEFDLASADADRRRSHGEYFRQPTDATAEPTGSAPTPTPAPPPHQSTPTPLPHAAAQPKPAPAKPRPAADYTAIPPGARAPYSPGSMAGAPPSQDGDEQARDAA
jgi:hypothetical protein